MKKTPNDSKNHHFLPQSLLRNFSFDNNERIWIYDKLRGNQFTNTVEKVGSEKGYNTIEYLGTICNLESSFQNFDDTLAIVSRKIIINENLSCLTQEEYDFLYILLLVQIHRSPIIRSTLQFIHQQINSIVSSVIGSEPDKDLDDNLAKAISLKTIFNKIEPLLGFIKKRSFVLQKTSNDELYFITSDNAAVLIGHSKYESVSLKSLYTEICFPLSLSYVLSLLPQIICDELNNKKVHSTKKIREAVYDKNPLILGEENVLFLNSIQVNQSKRFLYSKYDIKEYFDTKLQYTPTKKEKKSFINIGMDALKANVRESLHIVFYINNYYYDFDIQNYVNSKKNQEVLLVLKEKTIDKYLGIKIPQIFIYDKKFPVLMIRNIVITKLEGENGLYYYRVIPEIDFPA